jgi:methylated-DNA-[protein]-cysteine S-methyltransferase
MRFTVLDSPLGGLLAVRDDVGLTGLYLPTGRHVVSPRPSWRRADADFDDERGQLAEYFAGTRMDFELTLNPAGTPFQLTVWSALREIPYGATASYGKIAAAIGRPDAARAVGWANGQNPIRSSSRATESSAQTARSPATAVLPAKRWLLAHEAEHAGLTSAVTRIRHPSQPNAGLTPSQHDIGSYPNRLSVSWSLAVLASLDRTSAEAAGCRSRSAGSGQLLLRHAPQRGPAASESSLELMRHDVTFPLCRG